MTMPSKIWAGAYPEDTEAGAWSMKQELESDNQYIRADLADELARALEGVMHYVSGYAGSDEQDAVDEALTRYKETTA